MSVKRLSPPARGDVLDRLSTSHGLVMLVLSLAVLAWFVPVSIRILAYDALPVGAESYLHARMARQALDYGPGGWDRLQERQMQPNPYHLYLASLLRLFGDPLGYWASTLLLTGATLAGLTLLLVRLGVSARVMTISLLVWVLSPAYLRLSLVLSPVHLGLPLCLFAVALLMTPAEKRKPFHLLAAAALLFASSFLGVFSMLLALAALIVASLALKEPLLGLLTVLGLPVSVMYLRQLSLTYPLLQPFFVARPYFQELLSDLGAPVGFSVFALFLGAFAVFSAWKRRLPYNPAYLPGIVLSLAFLYFPRDFTLYASVPLAFLAGIGFLSLWERRWEVDLVRTLTLILVVCGLLFTGLSYLTRAVGGEPRPSQAEAFRALAAYPPGTVFSHQDNGFSIEYFSGKRAYIDNLLTHPDLRRIAVADALAWNRNLPSTLETLSGEGIAYVLIDPQMTSGKIWHRADEGFLFLLHDNHTFERLFTLPGADAWLVRKVPEADSPQPNIIYTTP